MSDENKNASAEGKSLKCTLTFVVVGLMATALLGGLKLAFERWSYGHRAELFAFELLQGQLPYFDHENPVVVLDTTDLRKDPETSRERLMEIIGALADQNPSAIGVDWDFSPKETEHASTKDPEFFDFCLDVKQKKKVPIFLGVNKSKYAKTPAGWLGDEKYKELAASVAANEKDTSKLPLWIQRKGVAEPLPSLGYALAKVYADRLPEPPSWIRWAVKDGPVVSPDYDFVYEDRLVNYSNLEAMKAAAHRDLSATSVTESGRKSYEGKIVLLGDASKGFADSFHVPGQAEPTVGGVLLHASAAYTFVKEPLFEFKHSVRIVLDFVIAGVIVVAVAFFSYRHAGERDSSLHRRQARYIWVAMVGVALAGWLLVLFSRVMWLDFLVVLVALYLHPKLEGWIHVLTGRRNRDRQGRPAVGTTDMKAAVWLLAALLWLAPSVQAQRSQDPGPCQDRVAAVVLRLKEKGKKEKGKSTRKAACYFREDRNAEWHELSAADTNKPLHAGQEVCCEKDYVLVIWLCGAEKEFEVKKIKPESYRVLNTFKYEPTNGRDPYDGSAAPPQPELVFRPPNPPAPSVIANYQAGDRVLMMRNDVRGARRRSSEEGADLRARPAPTPRATPAGEAAVTYPSAGESSKGIAEVVRRDARVKVSPHSGEVARWLELEERYASMLDVGNTSRDVKDYPAAERFYKFALQLLPNDPRALYGLGNVYTDQGLWNEAERSYRQALALDPVSVEAHLALGFVMLQPREGVVEPSRLAAAEAVLRRAASLAPSDSRAYDLLAAALAKRGASASEFEQTYRNLIRRNPTSAEAHLRLAELLLRTGREGSAEDHLQRAAKMAYGKPTAWKIAAALESMGEYKDAERLLSRTLLYDQRDARTLYMLGRVLLLRGRYSEAVSPLRRAAAVNPQTFAPRFLLGLAYLRAGRLLEAEQAFAAAAGLVTPGNRELRAVAYGLSSVGDAYAQDERLTDAVRLYEQALQLDPDEPDTKNKLARARAQPER